MDKREDNDVTKRTVSNDQIERHCLENFFRIRPADPSPVCQAIVTRRNPGGAIFLGYCYTESFTFLLHLGLEARQSAAARRLLSQSWLVHGTRIGGGHAWVELPENVIFDGVFQRFCRKQSYYRLQKAHAYQKFRPGAAFMLMEHLIRTDLTPEARLSSVDDLLLFILVALNRRDVSEKVNFNWWHRLGFRNSPKRPVLVDQKAAQKLISALDESRQRSPIQVEAKAVQRQEYPQVKSPSSNGRWARKNN